MNRSASTRKHRGPAQAAGRRKPAQFRRSDAALGAQAEDEPVLEDSADDLDEFIDAGTDFDADAVELVADVLRIHGEGEIHPG